MTEKNNGNKHMADEPLSQEMMQDLGVSQGESQEICAMLGRNPTADELSTLLAMWDASGRMQSLLAWLRGQPRSEDSHDYLVGEEEKSLYDIREPRVAECMEIARDLLGGTPLPRQETHTPASAEHGDAIYMAGRVSASLAHSAYARQYLHLTANPISMDSEQEAISYIKMILQALQHNEAIRSYREIGRGGIFGTLLETLAPLRLGFDIMSYREVRLDAFLFGEERGRCIALLPTEQEELFLHKMDDARLNCCYLGRATKGRVLVDGMDYGPLQAFFQ